MKAIERAHGAVRLCVRVRVRVCSKMKDICTLWKFIV